MVFVSPGVSFVLCEAAYSGLVLQVVKGFTKTRARSERFVRYRARGR